MKLHLEKILTITAEEYCKMTDTCIKDYIPQGVSIYRSFPEDEVCAEAPPKTVVVVAYQPIHNADNCCSRKLPRIGIGTALTPKES